MARPTVNVRLSRWVKDSRTKKGMSQRKLSSAIGMRQATLCRIELGKQSLRADQFVFLIRKLGQPDWLR